MAFEIALIGNPNVGKTSIFNLLTGARQYVANWPGVTVEKKVGSYNYKGHTFKVIDLPGIYTLSATSEDEKVARDYLLNESPDVVVVICDALNLERGMFLLLQILEMNIPTILVVNAIDEAQEKNMVIDKRVIESRLGIPVILTSAKKGIGINELKDSIHKLAETKHFSRPTLKYSPEIERFLKVLKDKILKNKKLKSFDPRWLALYILEFGEKSFEGAEELLKDFTKDEINKLRDKFIEERLKFMSDTVKSAIVRSGRTWSLRDILDHVFTHKVLGLLIYFMAMYFLFNLTFKVASPLSDALDLFIGFLGDSMSKLISNEVLRSLIVDGIIGGVGAVLVFIPQIFVLFFFLGFLEETGYLPRAAFLIDRIVRYFGLSGRSFISVILGFGCNVPAIMSTKTISNKGERLSLILSIPFASCSARLPVYIMLTAAFFSKRAPLILFIIYFSSILLVFISAKFIRIFIKEEENIPFIIELPRFRLPTFRNLILYTWNKGKHFLEKAGTIILLASIVLWLLSYFPSMGVPEKSFAAYIGKSLTFLTNHLGWDWVTNTALIFGVAAKEIVVSTFSMMLLRGEEVGIQQALQSHLTPAAALSLLFFIMAYVPCIPTISAIIAETGKTKWGVFAALYTTFVAYILANIVYFIASAFIF